jgi:hypothetical protein
MRRGGSATTPLFSMRTFAPSLIALAAGMTWLLIWSTLIPASDDGSRVETGSAVVAMRGVCSAGSLVARLPEVHEASGLALSRRHTGVLWTHNDSGRPMLYAVGVDGRLRARVAVTGAQVDDWEAVETGSCPHGSCVYIGDIGDNKEARQKITVYRVPEPGLNEAATARAEAFSATYPEGPRDAEAFFVGTDGTLFIVTKGEGSPISVYRLPAGAAPGTTAPLEHVATLAGKGGKNERITDADLTPDGKWVALRTLGRVEFHRIDALLRGGTGTDEPIEVDVSGLREPQGEGIAVGSDGTVFLAGESGDGVHGGTLARLSCKLP